jgi:hypothetical protein
MAKKNIVIFDLDGTIANNEHRAHHLLKEPKDWDTFFAECPDDSPVDHIIEILKGLKHRSYEIWIVSGRSDQVRAKTEHWLSEKTISYSKLIMRRETNHTEDSALKISWLHDGTIPKERIFCVFEDKTSVVNAWRAEGLPCLQVTEGDAVSRLKAQKLA